MNWLKKTLDFGQKIKRLLKKRPSRQDMEEMLMQSQCHVTRAEQAIFLQNNGNLRGRG